MTYNLLIVGKADGARMAEALAELVRVPVSEVDVAGEDDDDRNWAAKVLITRTPSAGDVSESLDVYLDADGPQPPEAEAASRLARALGTPVLYPAEEPVPSAYWVATPEGRRVRARIDVDDDGDPPAVRIDAVEHPVAALSGAQVRALPDVIREHRMPTLLADRVRVLLDVDGDRSHWAVATRLAAWEALVARIEFGWPPDGWFPAGYYSDGLRARDELTVSVGGLDEVLRTPVAAALAEIDAGYERLTHDDGGAALAAELGTAAMDMPADRWWWRRIPRPVPWERQPGR